MTLQEVENYYGEDSYPYVFEALSIIEDCFEFYIKGNNKKQLWVECKSDISDATFTISYRGAVDNHYYDMIFRSNDKDNEEIRKYCNTEYEAYKYIQELFGVEITHGWKSRTGV